MMTLIHIAKEFAGERRFQNQLALGDVMGGGQK